MNELIHEFPETHAEQPDVPRRRRWVILLVLLVALLGLLWVYNWFYQRSRLFTRNDVRFNSAAVRLGEPTLPWGMLIGDYKARVIFGVPVHLSLLDKDLTPYQISFIGGNTSLESLKLRGLTDTDVHRLSGLINLKTLCLVNSPISDEACQIIGQFDKLTKLSVFNSNAVEITDAGLQHLGGLKEVSVLHLQVPKVTDSGLKHIAQLEGLTNLYLKSAQIHGDGLQEVAQLKNIESLQLDFCPLKGDCLSHLADYRRLSRILLRGSSVTDDMLDDLVPLTSLTSLGLYGTKVTIDGCERFQEARPDVNLFGVRRPHVDVRSHQTTSDGMRVDDTMGEGFSEDQ